MRVLVTGHQGRIGRHLMPALLDAGHEVKGVDVKSGVDILSPGFAMDATMDYYPEVVIHLAALASVQDSVEDPVADAATNIMGTLAILEMSREIGCKLIVAGSAGTVYDVKSPYGLSKKVAKEYTSLYGALFEDVEAVVLGIGNAYGPGMGGVVGQFIEDKDDGVTIFDDGMQTRDFVHVDDVVQAFVEAFKWPAGYYEVATGILTSVCGVLDILADQWGSTPRVTYADQLPGEVYMSQPLRCDLPWTPISIKEGLARMVADG